MRWWQDLCDDMAFVGDVQVIEARNVQMEYFWKMGVYENVHKSKARGNKVIATRLVDTNRCVGISDD